MFADLWLTIKYGDLWVGSPISVIMISVKVSLADDLRILNSDDRNGGKKLRPSAVYTGLCVLGRRNI